MSRSFRQGTREGDVIMADTLFAPMAPMWPTVPAFGSGWFQSSVPANRPAINEMPADTMGFSNGVFVGPSASHALVAAVALRRGQPMGPTNDQETEDLICDALDLLPGASDVEIRCENGRATLTGSVPHKRVKRDVGEIAWAIPSVNDVQNNVTIAPRRRSRTPTREAEASSPAGSSRKQT
jgi:BON domain-containing protein